MITAYIHSYHSFIYYTDTKRGDLCSHAQRTLMTYYDQNRHKQVYGRIDVPLQK